MQIRSEIGDRTDATGQLDNLRGSSDCTALKRWSKTNADGYTAYMNTATDMNLGEIEALRAGTIFVSSHRGLVGSASVRRLERAGCANLLLKTRDEIDLLNQH